jgi:uncharacterized glyoxalase superfamily protein PhnB
VPQTIDWLSRAFGFREDEAAAQTGATVRAPEDVEEIGVRRWTGEDLEGHRWMFTQALDA